MSRRSPKSWSELLSVAAVGAIQEILEATPHSVDSLLKELHDRGHAPLRRSVRTFLEEGAQAGLVRWCGGDIWAMPPDLDGEEARSHPLLRYRGIPQRAAILDLLGDGSRAFSEREIVRGVIVGGLPVDALNFRITVYQVMREFERKGKVVRSGGGWRALGEG